MADDITPGVPEDFEGLSASDSVDPAELDRVRALLADLRFLRPDSFEESAGPGVSEPTTESMTDTTMPPWVWARISAALAAESADAPSTRRPAWVRWGGGLVAASVAVLAVGIAVTTFSGGSDQELVAGGTPDGVPSLSFAGMVPPALRLVDSRTDYTDADLDSQVSEVLVEEGMEPEAAMLAMKEMMSSQGTAASQEMTPLQAPAPDSAKMQEPALTEQAGDLFTSARSLRDCITKLTQLATSTALLIDWATYDGQDAAVVVAPDYPPTPASLPDTHELDVWVVDHDCDVKTAVHLSIN